MTFGLLALASADPFNDTSTSITSSSVRQHSTRASLLNLSYDMAELGVVFNGGFSDLPFELRDEIYSLTLSSRVVQLEERHPDSARTSLPDSWRYADEAYGLFMRDLADPAFASQLILHQDLVWFTSALRCLDDPLLTDAQRRFIRIVSTCHYHSTSETRPSPHNLHRRHTMGTQWLLNNPKIAFQVARKRYLFSRAPIPTLLHVCNESRQALINRGYELAFATPNHGPRTWFNFDLDRLYLTNEYGGCLVNHVMADAIRHGPAFLSAEPYGLFRFQGQDLIKVRKIVLGRYAKACLCTPSSRFVENIYRLLPNLQELFLEVMPPQEIARWLTDPVEPVLRRRYKRAFSAHPCMQRDETIDPRQSIRFPNGRPAANVCIAAEDVDFLGQLYWRETSDPPFEYFSWPRSRSKALKNFYERSCEVLQKERSETIRDGQTVFADKPLLIKYVHVCPEHLAERFIRGRYKFWDFFTSFSDMISTHGPLECLQRSHLALEAPFTFYWEPTIWPSSYWQQFSRSVMACDLDYLLRHPLRRPQPGDDLMTMDVDVPQSRDLLQVWCLRDFAIPEPSLAVL